MRNALHFANTKTISRVGTFAFAAPVSYMRIALVLAFFLVQWNVYAVVLETIGAFGLVNFILSLAASSTVTYKLFPFIRVKSKQDENIEK